MKYALCFFGLIRSFEKIHKLILNNFKINEGDTIDIFITTSNYNNKKYRFRQIKEEYLEIDVIKDKIKNIIGDKVVNITVLDDRLKKYSRCERIINLLTNVKDYQLNNNFKYNKIILHRLDILFVKWQTADKYYEDRKEGVLREKGVKFIDKYPFPIGVKEHGCCCIQKYPEKVDTQIDLDVNLDPKHIICYEDYWIGHVPIDFMIFNPNNLEMIITFYKNYLANQFINIGRNGQKINSFQSYDSIDKKWWLYNDSKLDSLETQIKLMFEMNNIKLIPLRFQQDISVLYIR